MTIMPEYSDLSYTLAGVKRQNPYDRRRRFAQQMMQSGMDFSPVQHPLQGAARLAQALVGGWMGSKADADEEAAAKKQQEAFATAMSETDPQKRITMIAAVDPQLGARLSGQLAIEQHKLGQQREGLQTAAGNFGASYGAPSGGPPQGGQLAVPQGTAPGNPGGFANNVGNIRATNINWEGKGAPHNGFETFGTPQAGANAMAQNLRAYVQRNPNMTIAQAIATWAPPNENNTQAYIRGLAEATGINPGMPLAEVLRDPVVAAQLMDGIARIEKGGMPQGFTADTFINAAGGGNAPRPTPLTINMTPGGPSNAPQPQIPQGDNAGMPPAPSPQAVSGPVLQAPQVPETPRPQPTPEQVAKHQQLLATGAYGSGQEAIARARAALESEIDREWDVRRDRDKMRFDQQSQTYSEARKPTEAQKSVDTNFGKEYAEWVAGGGMADTRRQIVQLEEVLGKLKSGANLTGPFIGNMPDFALNVLNPSAVATRNAVEEVVQRNLRLVLGAQFTEKEGERLIARAYNPSLSEEENAKRVGRLLEQIKAGAAAKASAGQYYEQNGTLRGWTGKLPTITDFDPDARPDRGSASDLKKKYGLE